MAKTNELVMPGSYIDMNDAELEYDGGGFWNVFSNVLLAVGVVALIVAVTFLSGGLALGIGAAGLVVGQAGGFGAYKTGKIGFGDFSMKTKAESLSDYCNYDSTLGDGSGQ